MRQIERKIETRIYAFETRQIERHRIYDFEARQIERQEYMTIEAQIDRQNI